MSAGFRKDAIPELDGLRAVAVLLVLWQHVPRGMLSVARGGAPPAVSDPLIDAYLSPGYVGVDLFFVLSGFLITRILLVDSAAGVPVRWFLARRSLRIFPIYFLLLAVVWLVRPGPELPWCAVYLSNLYFSFEPVPSPLRHTWSLAVEEHFYLLWPLAVVLLGTTSARRVASHVLLPVAVMGSLLASFWLRDDIAQAYEVVQLGTPFRAGSLAVGSLLAFAEPGLRSDPSATLRRALGWVAAGLLAFGAGALLVRADGLAALGPVFRGVSVAIVSAGLVASCIGITGETGVAARSLRAAPLRGIGRISYGLYLYHFAIFWWLGIFQREPTDPAPVPIVVLALVLTFATAALSYVVLERPILRYGDRFRSHPA